MSDHPARAAQQHVDDLEQQPDFELGPEWDVKPIDPLAGARVPQAELRYRERIRQEAAQGFIGMDALYLSVQQAIHQPLVDEQGQILDDTWHLERANKTILAVPIGDTRDPGALERAAVDIVASAIGSFAAEVMLRLFAYANDPPNWRRPNFTIRLSELLDALGFKRDARGLHYSANRRRLTSTLLALHLTHVGLQQDAARRGGRAVGFIAPLLSTVGYATEEDVRHLNAWQVFQMGLPDEVMISIHPLWFQGLRDQDGVAGMDYALIPRPRAGNAGRQRGGSKSPVIATLREYLLRCQNDLGTRSLTIARDRLLQIANITNQVPRHASRTLERALMRLQAEQLIHSYAPVPLSNGASDLITIEWLPPHDHA